MLYSITASHYDCDIKNVILKHTIESLVKNDIDKCFVSISFDSQQHYLKYKNKIEDIKTLFGERLEIHIHHSKFYQFQHLQYLCQVMTAFANPTDKILFCDDDDLLIRLPPVDEYDTIAGFQYLTDIYETNPESFIDHTQFVDMLKSPESNSWEKINDFSGYVCKYELFQKFFEMNTFDFTSKDPLEIWYFQLIDTKFMTFLDSTKPHISAEPFIYHRCWSVKDRTIQQWRQNCARSHSLFSLNNVSKTRCAMIGAGICITIGAIIKFISRLRS
jgi:hypothetical protein